MKEIKVRSGWLLVPLFLLIGGIACTNYTIPGRDSIRIDANSCEGCHTDLERLIAVHSPDTAPPAGGCGGTAPHYEPYDRVFMGGEGYEAFQSSGHYSIGCTGCHNGVGDTGEKTEAHSGDFISHPSMQYQEKCGDCHGEITEDFTTSIHNGTGQKRKVAIRHGGMSSADFENLSDQHKMGYENNCAHCHGTCGNCHVVRPATGGGGLSAGHNFNKEPSMINVCVTCHTSRGGHAFLGVAPGTEPDVHLDEGGFDCLSCHDGHELHGDGQPVEQRYAYSELPQCEDCHTGGQNQNNYHTVHYDDFSCYVCHSQDYNNCGSCHIHGEGARVPAYLDFKLAVNPIPDVKSGFDSDITLVRRTLGAPDNWKEYGVEEYNNFDALPVYNYTSPHNIQRLTSRTDVGSGGCSSNCHLRIVDGDTINRELYLWKSDLKESWELSSSEFMTVDGKLPDSWLNK